MQHVAPEPDRTRRVIVIGGVAAGMSTATRLRRIDETSTITVLERGGYVSFANCGLAYYVGGVITDRDSLLLQSPERLHSRFRLDVRVHHEVTEIDLSGREVAVRAPDGTYRLPFDQLVIATGAKAVELEIPGGNRALPLRGVEDMERIVERVSALKPGSSVAVIGAGYIGLELADNLLARGFAVTLIQRGDHVLPNLDIEMAANVERRLRDAGVRLVLSANVAGIDERGVEISDVGTIHADLVVAGVGVVPDAGLASDAGIRVASDGGIVVDRFGRTSTEDVFAVGDVAQKDGFLGNPVLVALAGPANRDGRYVADTIAGQPRTARPVLGTSIVEIVGAAAGGLGITEAAARAAGREIRVIHTHPTSHAAYYPGAKQLALKLIVDAGDDRILGFQAVGESGVDKRIDVVATAMTAGMTASSLADLELAYAPQFGSAKDPINMLGYIAGNMASGGSPTVQWHELSQLAESGAAIIDVRTSEEFAAGAIPGAINIPLDELRERRGEIPDGQVVVHCQVGQRGHAAASLLRQVGHDAYNLDGGYRTWTDGMDARRLAHSTRNERIVR